MTDLRLSDIGKSYGETRVLSGIDLDIAGGEFVAVPGASGCGKTTLLRLIAGFDRPDEGTIMLGERQAAGKGVMVAPADRGIGIVFQNYALWPHMSVAENVGYALKVARLPRAEREARVARAGYRQPCALRGSPSGGPVWRAAPEGRAGALPGGGVGSGAAG